MGPLYGEIRCRPGTSTAHSIPYRPSRTRRTVHARAVGESRRQNVLGKLLLGDAAVLLEFRTVGPKLSH
jgi:hypothetical protein